MVAGTPGRHDHGMNALLILSLVAIPAALAVATRRFAGADGIGLVELLEVALSPVVGASAVSAVPEPDFVPWRFNAPRTPQTIQRRVGALPNAEVRSTAA